MEVIYKYCGAYGAGILRNLELKVTPPNQFNDPFEFTPKMICSDPLQWAKRTLSREGNRKMLYELRRSDRRFVGTFSEFEQMAGRCMSEWIKVLAEGPQLTLPPAEKEFLDVVSSEWGILSMSRGRDSILMWGHYCDKPLGLVIGFDKSAAIFGSSGFSV